MKKTAITLISTLLVSASALAESTSRIYEVTITNLTAGQAFTPIIATTHDSSIALFEPGQPASDEIEMLAEGGDTMPLQDLLATAPDAVHHTVTTDGLLGPGESVTFEIYASFRHNRLSLAAMLLPTHDTFVALNSFNLPYRRGTTTAVAYDAGTEVNDELCVNIPGPFCGGAPYSEEDGEGYVFVANGIHGIGDLDPAMFDWRNAVAGVSMRRIQ